MPDVPGVRVRGAERGGERGAERGWREPQNEPQGDPQSELSWLFLDDCSMSHSLVVENGEMRHLDELADENQSRNHHVCNGTVTGGFNDPGSVR
jgi:hypothetical protein